MSDAVDNHKTETMLGVERRVLLAPSFVYGEPPMHLQLDNPVALHFTTLHLIEALAGLSTILVAYTTIILRVGRKAAARAVASDVNVLKLALNNARSQHGGEIRRMEQERQEEKKEQYDTGFMHGEKAGYEKGFDAAKAEANHRNRLDLAEFLIEQGVLMKETLTGASAPDASAEKGDRDFPIV